MSHADKPGQSPDGAGGEIMLTGRMTAVDWGAGTARLETAGGPFTVSFDPADRDHYNRTRRLADCHVNVRGTPAGTAEMALEEMEHAALSRAHPRNMEEIDFKQFMRDCRDGVCTECRNREPEERQQWPERSRQ